MLFKSLIFLSTLLFCLSLSSELRHEPRVINGEDAQPGQFPWHVGVASQTLDAEMKLCSGAIISENWILTTAYCLENAFFIGIHAGSVDNYHSDGSVIITIDYLLHEEYNNSTLQNDIGLVYVYNSIEFNENISSVALADGDLEPGTVATISGWGHSGHDDTVNGTNILQYGTVSTMDNADCQKIYGSDVVTPGVICTSGDDSGTAPCFGDAGGPLVVNADSDPILIAIFSFIGAGNCTDYPAGYTNAAYYREWIREKTGI